MPQVQTSSCCILALLIGVLVHISNAQQPSQAATPNAGQTNQQCSPACLRGICRQAINSNAFYCDCSGTGYNGVACDTPGTGKLTEGLSAAASPAQAAGSQQPIGCAPACQNSGICKQEVNSAAYYCDCSSTGYGGIACTQALPASTAAVPSAASIGLPATFNPGCQHGGLCKEVMEAASRQQSSSKTHREQYYQAAN